MAPEIGRIFAQVGGSDVTWTLWWLPFAALSAISAIFYFVAARRSEWNLRWQVRRRRYSESAVPMSVSSRTANALAAAYYAAMVVSWTLCSRLVCLLTLAGWLFLLLRVKRVHQRDKAAHQAQCLLADQTRAEIFPRQTKSGPASPWAGRTAWPAKGKQLEPPAGPPPAAPDAGPVPEK